MDEILDQLMRACRELKAGINRIDKGRFEIYGKSKTNWIRWGSEFRVGVTKVPAGVLVAIDDLAAIPSDRFIKDHYATFSKRVPSSPLQAGVVDNTSIDGELDRC